MNWTACLGSLMVATGLGIFWLLFRIIANWIVGKWGK
jgi:hypothetical protein